MTCGKHESVAVVPFGVVVAEIEEIGKQLIAYGRGAEAPDFARSIASADRILTVSTHFLDKDIKVFSL